MNTNATFQVTQSDAELSSHSGLAFLGDIFRACEFKKRVDTVHLLRRPNPELRHGDVLSTMTALLFIGKPDYDAVKPFHDDLLLRKALGLSRVPSAETLRNRLDLAGNCFDEVIRDLSATIVRRFGKLTPCCGNHVPLDIDVTPFDNSGSHKEGVSRTYHNYDGYAPIMAYLGCEGYLINTVLREGKAHSQRDTPRFLRESLRLARQVTEKVTDRHGQLMLLPTLDVNTWWTSLVCAEKEAVQLYHEHGTSEQFHSELKSDMDLERLPSGKFSTNNLILLLGMFAYNALRLIGQRSLLLPGPYRKAAQRRRIRSVLQDIIYVACRVVSHARGWVLSFGCNNRWYPVLEGLHAAFT